MSVIEKNRRFYENYVADLIHTRFPGYEDRIAVGIAGEGSDCFGYDDEISRDHDFGTGVCLWVTDADMDRFGYQLSIAYNELVDSAQRSFYTKRLQERRGVMTIHDFYSDILRVDCDTENCRMTEDQWYYLDHSCLKTATNGEIFRDDLGSFTAFRKLLLNYYPDRVWRTRIAEQLHEYAASLQVNYARCMSRGDTVAAELCRAQGLRSAMELYFLLRREYPPYYKWTFRAMRELEAGDAVSGPAAAEAISGPAAEGVVSWLKSAGPGGAGKVSGTMSGCIQSLAQAPIRLDAWNGVRYHPDRVNRADRVVALAEETAARLEEMLADMQLIRRRTGYLETHVDEVLNA